MLKLVNINLPVEKALLLLTTDVRIAELGRNPVLELPRLDCNDFPPNSENYKLYVEEYKE